MANNEIKNWKRTGDFKEGNSYIMWYQEDWDDAMKIEPGIKKTCHAMATAQYIGSQRNKPFTIQSIDRWNDHHFRVLSKFDLNVAAHLMKNGRMKGVYCDISRILNDPKLYLVAEAIKIRRLKSLGVRLKNESNGGDFTQMIKGIDTQKWDAVTYKIFEHAIENPTALCTTTDEQIRTLQSTVEQLECLKNIGISLFLQRITHFESQLSLVRVFDDFDESQMYHYAQILLNSNVCSESLAVWLKGLITSDEQEMVACPVARDELIRDTTTELRDKLIARTNQQTSESIMKVANEEIEKWKCIKDHRDGLCYIAWDQEDWDDAMKIEPGIKKTCHAMATAQYVGFECIAGLRIDGYQSNPIGYRSNHGHNHLNVESQYDMYSFNRCVRGNRNVTAYFKPFAALSLSIVAEAILITTLKYKLGVPLKNVSNGVNVADYIKDFDRSKWFDVAFKMFEQAIENPTALFTTTDEQIQRAKFDHVKFERLLKVDPLIAFMKEIRSLQSGSTITHVNGFNSEQVKYYTTQLVECNVLIEFNNDTYELNPLFQSNVVVNMQNIAVNSNAAPALKHNEPLSMHQKQVKVVLSRSFQPSNGVSISIVSDDEQKECVVISCDGETFWAYALNDDDFSTKFIDKIRSLGVNEVLVSSKVLCVESIVQPLAGDNVTVTVHREQINGHGNSSKNDDSQLSSTLGFDPSSLAHSNATPIHSDLMPAALSDLFKKFTKQNNAGGGACAFIAFTHGYNYTVGANAITPDGARRAACAYMAQQPDRFHPYVEREYDRFELEEGVKVKNFAEYIQYMRIPNSWGGPAELTALGEAYGVDVAVFDTRFNKFTDLVSGNPSKVCLYLSGNHYEALIPKCSGNPNPVERIYQFNEHGQLRQVNPDDDSITDKPYHFEVSNDPASNQAHYEELGEMVTESVYEFLIEIGLRKIYIPSPKTETSSFVFATKTDFKNTKKLMFLIHGSGAVRAGQWSRRLIINQSVHHGTQIPYILRAVELGYDVLVMNTNLNHRIKDGKRIPLDGHRSPKEHLNSVWKQLIEPALDTISELSIVAYSAGGAAALHFVDEHLVDFLQVNGKVCLIDSVHTNEPANLKYAEYLQDYVVHLKCSSEKLGTKLIVDGSVIPTQSAGDDRHAYAPFSCIELVFESLQSTTKNDESSSSMDTTVSDVAELDIDKLGMPNCEQNAPKSQARNRGAPPTDTELSPPAENADSNAEAESKMNPTETDLSQIDSESEKEFTLKIVSWNVAGLRALVTKTGIEYFEHEKPDIICLQEIKCLEEEVPEAAKLLGYHPCWCAMPGERGGVAILSKQIPCTIEINFNIDRIITVEYATFYLVCAHAPNAGPELDNLDERLRWNHLFDAHVAVLSEKKPVIVCGDMNVTHEEIDSTNPKTNRKNAGFSDEKRQGMIGLLALGFVDTFRTLYPSKDIAYTFWSDMSGNRKKNVGWRRLDYAIVSENLKSQVVGSFMRPQILGSDHCPIVLLLNI